MDTSTEVLAKACAQCVRGNHLIKKMNDTPFGGVVKLLSIHSLPREETRTDSVVGLPTAGRGFHAIVTIVCRLTKMARLIPRCKPPRDATDCRRHWDPDGTQRARN